MTNQDDRSTKEMPAEEAPARQPTPVSFWYILLLTSFTLGTAGVYSCNQQILQLTARKYFDVLPAWLPSALFIGLVISIQEFGQILATPYAAWKSDRIWTRFGRRRPLVMIVAPLLAVAIFLVPRCPTLGGFLLVVLILQIAEGAELAVMMPSIHDSVPDKQRPLAVAVSQMAMAIPGFILGKYVMEMMLPGVHKLSIPLVGRLGIHSPSILVQGAHHWPYTLAACVVVVSTVVYLLVMREKYVPPRTTEKFRLFTYSKEMFRLREHRLIWLVFLFQPLFMVVATEFMPTLGTVEMGLNMRDYGDAYSWRGLTQLLLAIPLGYLFTRIKKRRMVCLAVCVYAMIPATFGIFFMRTKLDLAIFFASHILAFLIFRMNFIPLVMEYTTPRNVGTILGFSSAVNGVVRMVIIPIIGFLIGVVGSTRVPLYATYVGSIVCIIALLMMRPAEQVTELMEDG